jgi:hypothetical protein
VIRELFLLYDGLLVIQSICEYVVLALYGPSVIQSICGGYAVLALDGLLVIKSICG